MGDRRSFVLELARGLPMQLWSAALNGRKSRGRRSRGIRYMFPHDLRTIESRSRNIPCWPFLSRETQVHLKAFRHKLIVADSPIKRVVGEGPRNSI